LSIRVRAYDGRRSVELGKGKNMNRRGYEICNKCSNRKKTGNILWCFIAFWEFPIVEGDNREDINEKFIIPEKCPYKLEHLIIEG
jgi:hypothetical protein